MRNFNYRNILKVLLLGVLLIASFNIAWAFLQLSPDPSQTITVNVPWLLWIPFILGFLGHWVKKYYEDKVTNTFLNYFTTGIFRSITAVLGGFVSFIGLYSMNPVAYPETLPGFIGVFLISYGWVSLANRPGEVLAVSEVAEKK